MTKLRFATVGCGVIQDWHAEAIRAHSGKAELVAVCDVVPERAKERGAKWGATAYPGIDEMLKDDRIDVVTIATPSGMHAEHATAAIRKGKHVVVEKPIDIHLKQADQIIAEARKAGVTITCISNTRYGEGVRKLHEWLDQGKLGKLVYGAASIFWWRTQAYYDSGDWRGTWALDGGGALMNQGVHYVDQLRWAMGNPKSLFAYAGTLGHERIEVEDVVSATILFENGAIGNLTATTCAYPGYGLTLDIVGTEGSVRIVDHEIVAANFKDGESFAASKEAKAPIAAGDPKAMGSFTHTCQFGDFIDAVLNKRAPWISAETGRSALELVLGVYKSARTGQTVNFPLDPNNE